MDKESFRFYLGIYITFCITCFIWIVFGDYMISSQYCVINNTFTGEYNKTYYHYPSMIVNYGKNVTVDNKKDTLWNDKEYKEKYLGITPAPAANNSEIERHIQ